MHRRPLVIMSALFIALLIAVIVSREVDAQGNYIVVTSAAQVTGTGTAVQIATSGTARWVQVVAITGNSATVNCGDSLVSATRGIPIAAGGGFMFPTIAPDSRQAVQQRYYDLSKLYCYIGNSDKANFVWGN